MEIAFAGRHRSSRYYNDRSASSSAKQRRKQVLKNREIFLPSEEERFRQLNTDVKETRFRVKDLISPSHVPSRVYADILRRLGLIVKDAKKLVNPNQKASILFQAFLQKIRIYFLVKKEPNLSDVIDKDIDHLTEQIPRTSNPQLSRTSARKVTNDFNLLNYNLSKSSKALAELESLKKIDPTLMTKAEEALNCYIRHFEGMPSVIDVWDEYDRAQRLAENSNKRSQHAQILQLKGQVYSSVFHSREALLCYKTALEYLRQEKGEKGVLSENETKLHTQLEKQVRNLKDKNPI